MTASSEPSTGLCEPPSVSAESIITFPSGLIGQPDWKRFVLLTSEDDDRVGVLQSVDSEDLSLLVTDPARVLPEYRVELSAADRETIGLDAHQQPVVMTTLSVYAEVITTNLVGPLVINPATHTAKQVVLLDSSYTTRYPVGVVAPQEATRCSS
jgi:flagellar assembly factor FliW